MNILLIHQYFLENNEPGGSRFNEMAKVWVESGNQVTVVCGLMYYLGGKIPQEYKGLKFHLSEYYPGLTVLRCYVSPEYNTNFRGRLWGYFSFVWYSSIGIVSKLKGRKYDVIIATSPPLFVGIIAWMASKLRSIPFVFEVRDLWPESAIDAGVLKNKFMINLSYWFEKFIYSSSFLINVLTPAFRDSLISNKKIDLRKIIYIPNACDFTMSDGLLVSFNRNEFRAARGWDNYFVVTYVGAHGVANHLGQLLDAAYLLKDKKIKIVLIGDGMKKEDLIADAHRRGLKNVEFIDSMPKREVIKFIMASDAGASVLKKAETFKTVYSNKTFDYMSCKKPVIMVIDGISRQLVEDAGCGLYAEPENALDISKKIEILFNDRALALTMGEKGYLYAKENFDRSVLAQKYMYEITTRLTYV